jgi:hypothetical protein
MRHHQPLKLLEMVLEKTFMRMPYSLCFENKYTHCPKLSIAAGRFLPVSPQITPGTTPPQLRVNGGSACPVVRHTNEAARFCALHTCVCEHQKRAADTFKASKAEGTTIPLPSYRYLPNRIS